MTSQVRSGAITTFISRCRVHHRLSIKRLVFATYFDITNTYGVKQLRCPLVPSMGNLLFSYLFVVLGLS